MGDFDKRQNHYFGPVISSDSEILILGSFPSVRSRAEAFYYMHPQNRFWTVLSKIYDDDFCNPDIEIKKKLLRKNKIAIYDVIESCDIVGSQDSSITNITPTDIKKLIEKTTVRKIFLNGRKAYDLYTKYNKNIELPYKYLPSTSPANARFGVDELVSIWKKSII